MKLGPTFIAPLGLLLLASPSLATTEQALVQSIYFRESADFGSDEDATYARHWRSWLQFHRAIERTLQLRQQILRLPKDETEGRQGALELMRKGLSQSFVRSQPTHVYVLQLGVYHDSSLIRRLAKKYEPALRQHDIYNTTPKSLTFGANTEQMSGGPLFVLPGRVNGQPAKKVCYGLYASTQDATRDAEQIKRLLGCKPVPVKCAITPQLAHAFVFDSLTSQRRVSAATR